jgi:hypothetical protein
MAFNWPFVAFRGPFFLSEFLLLFFNKNPFDFSHFDVNFLSVFVDSEQIPTHPYTPNFEEGLYVREYLSLFQALQLWSLNKGNHIDYEEFDLAPSLHANGLELRRQGNLKLKVKKWTLRDILTKFYTCNPIMNDCIVLMEYNKKC